MLSLKHLSDLALRFPEALKCQVKEFAVGETWMRFNTSPSVMGVINLSSDSWYRESVSMSVDAAIERGRTLALMGASIIDVGAESTLAHAARVDAEVQNSRLIPVVQGLSKHGVAVSIETYHPQVTEACLAAGAKVVNLTGVDQSPEIFKRAAAYDAAVIICFVQGANVREVGELKLSEDPIAVLYEFFARQIEVAVRNGVSKIFIDPGLGFYYRNLQDSAVRIRYQSEVFLNSFRLRPLGYPICQALPHAFEFFREEVRCAEPYFAVLAALGRTDLFRTHEVARIQAVLKTLDVLD